MIQLESAHTLEEIEDALRGTATRHGARVLSVRRLGDMLSEDARRTTHDAISFTLAHPELYGALLAADIRFSAFLPCRIAAIRSGDRVVLESLSPKHFCRHLNRPDLDRLAAPLETMLHELMEDVARA